MYWFTICRLFCIPLYFKSISFSFQRILCKSYHKTYSFLQTCKLWGYPNRRILYYSKINVFIVRNYLIKRKWIVIYWYSFLVYTMSISWIFIQNCIKKYYFRELQGLLFVTIVHCIIIVFSIYLSILFLLINEI